MSLIMVHGGAETRSTAGCLASLREAALAGGRALERGLLDAVELVVNCLEDDPQFNAGCGSVLNLDGNVEMDAAIMEGATGRCGAVAAISQVQHPVSVARLVMERTPHILLAGSGAVRFARSQGCAAFDPVTEQQRSAWQRAVANLQRGGSSRYNSLNGEPSDTVGCVAVHMGQTAAASSTGGLFLKLPGRVGDTPVIGGGLLATPAGAAICTGDGEAFVSIQGASLALALLERGANPAEAAGEVIARLNRGRGIGGILVVDAAGSAAAAHNGHDLPVALAIDGQVVENFTPAKI